MSEIDTINTANIEAVNAINSISKSNIASVNGILVPSSEQGWHTHFDNTQWEALQGWWDSENSEWDSNGWECVLSATGAPDTGTKIRITFTGASPLLVSVRNADGSTTYVSSDSYTSLTELNFTITDTFGRIYLENGSFSITNLELFY